VISCASDESSFRRTAFGLDPLFSRPVGIIPEPMENTLKPLTDLQSVTGFWSNVKKVEDIIGGHVDIFEELRSHEHSEKIFATVLALAYLRKHLTNERSSWILIETKSLEWLGKQGVNAEDLITRAMGMIPPSSRVDHEVDEELI
jgi:hypothetical protein